MKIIFNIFWIIFLTVGLNVSCKVPKTITVSKNVESKTENTPVVDQQTAPHDKSSSNFIEPSVVPEASDKDNVAEIHSSFGEIVKSDNVMKVQDEHTNDHSSVLQVGVDTKAIEPDDNIVFTLVDTAGAELRNRAIYDVPTTTGTTTSEGDNKTESRKQDEDVDVERVEQTNVTNSEDVSEEQVANVTAPADESSQHEDIPSFSEWTQKQLAAEAEKKKLDQNNNNVTTNSDKTIKSKIRNKNYASLDCGAKIVAANSEAGSPMSVLSFSRDEYMLNYCNSRIWFVVDLCEAIQAKELDLANFELFSSSPKEFSVYISNRFPTRDWTSVGRFTAEDNRDIQTFHLEPHLFGKYLKVEVHSYFGKEHFCPISLVRVYGTSEYEALATEDDRHDSVTSADDDDDLDDDFVPRVEVKNQPKNLFSSATDAVLSIVKKATAPFMKKDHNNTQVTQVLADVTDSSLANIQCVTPRYNIVCDNCTQHVYQQVYQLMSCKQEYLEQFLSSEYVRFNLVSYKLCGKFGLDTYNLESNHYLSALLPDWYLAVLCNYLAIKQTNVMLNNSVSVESDLLKNLTDNIESCDPAQTVLPSTLSTLVQQEGVDFSTSSLIKQHGSSPYLTQHIQPTKTLTEDEVKNQELASDSFILVNTAGNDVSATQITPTVTVDTGSTATTTTSVVSGGGEGGEVDPGRGDKRDTYSGEDLQDASLDSIFNDLNDLANVAGSSAGATTPSPPTIPVPKESTFIRLANRIKSLELNMSLSSSYLEEMSRRYRQQLDALAKTVNTTAQRVQEQIRVSEENERKKDEVIMLMQAQLYNLTVEITKLMNERNTWTYQVSAIRQHAVFVVVEIVVCVMIWSFCRKYNTRTAREGEESTGVVYTAGDGSNKSKKIKRRNSVEGVPGHTTPTTGLHRRPSDEALDIALCRAHDITEIDGRVKEKKRKRKKKDASRKNSSNLVGDHNLTEEVVTIKSLPTDELVIKTTNRFAPIASPVVSRSTNGEQHRRLSTPAFMTTAMSNRRMRISPEISSLKTVLNPPVEISPTARDSSPSSSINEEKKKITKGIKKYMKKLF